MSWRFHKRLRLFKGCWVNLSKGTPSISLREGPTTLNFKPGRPLRVTESLRGTGISFSQDLGTHSRRTIQRSTIGSAKPRKRRYVWLALPAFFVLWSLLAHHEKPSAVRTSSQGALEASPAWHDSGSASQSSPAAAMNVRKALPVEQDPRLPRHELTPGEAIEGVTVNDLRQPGYSKRARHVTESERRAVFAAYGLAWEDRSNYELDHLVSLEIGGSNSQRNLWPEPLRLNVGGKEEGAITKDRLENKLGQLVHSGALDLKTAQKMEMEIWVAAYERLIGPLPDYR